MAEKEKAEPDVFFVGSIAPLKNAVTFGSHGHARVVFEIPESDKMAANKLTYLQDKILNVSITVERDEKKAQDHISKW